MINNNYYIIIIEHQNQIKNSFMSRVGILKYHCLIKNNNYNLFNFAWLVNQRQIVKQINHGFEFEFLT